MVLISKLRDSKVKRLLVGNIRSKDIMFLCTFLKIMEVNNSSLKSCVESLIEFTRHEDLIIGMIVGSLKVSSKKVSKLKPRA